MADNAFTLVNPSENALNNAAPTPEHWLQTLQTLSKNLGFNAVGVSSIVLDAAEQRLLDWLDKGYQGDMAWMASHGTKRSRPAELVAGTLSVISVRMSLRLSMISMASEPISENEATRSTSRMMK